MLKSFLYVIFTFMAVPLFGVGPWEYRWGDSPFVEGQPVWALEDEDSGWEAIDFPSDPPGRAGRENVWFRIRLPEDLGEGKDLFITSIDLIGQVYLNGELLYAHGQFDENGKGRFVGWPWHAIPLPSTAAGAYLYFRVYSDYPDIGLWGDIRIESMDATFKRIVRMDAFPLALGSVLIFAGIGVLAIGLVGRAWTTVMLGLFLLNLGIMPITESHIKQLILEAPVFWQYLAAGNYFLLPVSMTGFIHARFGPGRWRLRPAIWGIHLVYFVLALGLSLAGVIHLSICYVGFDVIALVSLFLLCLSTLDQARRGGLDDRLLAGGICFTYLVLLYNGLTAHGFLPYAPRSEFLGPFVIGICFVYLQIHQTNQLKEKLHQRTKRLRELNLNLEDRIAKRTQELQRSNEAKDLFFAIIAHDLKSPVGGLKALLSEYATGDYHVSRNELKELHNSADGVYTLLDNLLGWAQGQRGELATHPAPHSLREIADEVISVCTIPADRKNIFLSNRIPADIKVLADRSMMAATMRNLISNAIKFSHSGGQITLSAEADAFKATVSCIDEGIGMSMDQVRTLFASRNTGKSQPGTEGEAGTGLGLLLCREFVRLNNGSIDVESETGKGTRIWFTVPLATS